MAISETRVLSPSWRAFLVYYVAIGLCVLGPHLNPQFSLQLGLTPLRGLIIGIILLLGVFYLKWNQEYQISPQGIKKVRRFPAHQEKLAWTEVDQIEMRRGLTQTLLQVGNVIVKPRPADKSLIMLYGIENPKEVKELMERARS
ncbi:MAG: hypothetical protein JRI57_05185 [Deltaproteobacteria bacterium]|nr:hypothetical protein [Deltaproteobacteria bacterium]MBW1953342.1 hypothetical protein [Deltaproteobacteria bacterium]MBW1987316.1 hypothetical protein [Deltaproteobacteria bacterium]MBW2135073.1 hypothetical protein [Deltaproteobacteria bacterium]